MNIDTPSNFIDDICYVQERTGCDWLIRNRWNGNFHGKKTESVKVIG